MSTISTYKVVKGDTLFGIAKKFSMTVEDLKILNALASNNLSIGQALKVRLATAPVPVKPTPVVPVSEPPVPSVPISNGGFLAARQEYMPEIVQDAGFRRYFLRVRVAGGGLVVANMRDNVANSRFMVFPQGIMYGGQSLLALEVATIQSVGLTPAQAKALQFISLHEGKFDAINSYDKGIFSYGFIQFTAATATGASLNRVLSSMKTNAPAVFQRIFQRVGIDSEGLGKAAQTTVLDEAGRKLRGDEAWLYLQREVRLYGPFIQAGFEPLLVREQLRMANDLYVQPALDFKLDVLVGGIRITVPRLRDILTSEGALTVAIALAVNQGVGGMSRIFSTAVGSVAAQAGLQTLPALAQVNERQVIETIASTTSDERVRNRAVGVLNSDLSFA